MPKPTSPYASLPATDVRSTCCTAASRRTSWGTGARRAGLFGGLHGCLCHTELQVSTAAVRASQYGFKKNKLGDGCQDVLAYLERCRVGELGGAWQPLALEVCALP